jgi:CheY-like chemotaxis protein
VRAVLGERKLVQQASDPFLAGLAVLSGTARIEGGELVSVLNVSHLLRQVEAGGAGISAAPLRSAAAAEPVQSVGAVAAPTRGGAQTVLVVEDSDITRRMLVAAVGRLGYQTVEAVNGREGLDKFEAHSPDLVLTDLDMPVMTGIELLRALRQRGSQCPCVVMTSRESEESKAEALAAGANAYLLKSAHSDARLKDALGMMLGARAEAAA